MADNVKHRVIVEIFPTGKDKLLSPTVVRRKIQAVCSQAGYGTIDVREVATIDTSTAKEVDYKYWPTEEAKKK